MLGQVHLKKRCCRGGTWDWRTDKKSQSAFPLEISAFIPRQSLSLLNAFRNNLWTAHQGEGKGIWSHGHQLPHISPSLILQMSSDQAQSALHLPEQSSAVCLWLLSATHWCEMISWCMFWTKLAAMVSVLCRFYHSNPCTVIAVETFHLNVNLLLALNEKVRGTPKS